MTLRTAVFSVLLASAVSPASAASPATARPTFRLEVMAVLSRAGCNTGACHGNQNGKGGFKLSLRGQDPADDYRWLTRQFAARRVNRLKPADSLILLKPTGAVAHQGGVRFRIGSPEYLTLLNWLQSGAKGPQKSTPRVLQLTVTPAEKITSESSLQLSVTARLSDGTTRDVTRQAVYETSNLLSQVTPNGQVRRNQFGETTVIVRFLDQQVAVPVAFLPAAEKSFRWVRPPENNYVDQYVFHKLRKLRVTPSKLSPDNIFIRRLFLDVMGVLPTVDEAREFLADKRADKRSRLIDRVLSRPEFADHWALKWSDLLRNEEKVLDTQGVAAFYRWIRQQIVQGTPVNKFVYQLLVATGSTYKVPAANYYRANRTPVVRAEATARLFLGIRLQCAKCHNHPFDRWTQADYYSWASFFARVKYKIVKNKRRDKFDKNEFVGEQLVQVARKGDVKNARTGKVARPKFLGAARPRLKKNEDRRLAVARWLTSKENRMFARSQANLVWFHLMRRGLVVPIDDFRITNPPSHPRLMERLADDFVAHDFDLRHLVRVIVSSRTYQLSAIPNETNKHDQNNYSRAIVERLTAEQLLDAQSSALENPARFVGYPVGLRAGQIPGVRKIRRRSRRPQEGDRFLATFGKPERLLACECERSNETTLKQVFVLLGGDGLQARIENSQRIRRLVSSNSGWKQKVVELYWATLTRPPKPVEIEAATAFILRKTEKNSPQEEARWMRLALEDLAWALLNAKEFVFRH